jgi:hypothetical protein
MQISPSSSGRETALSEVAIETDSDATRAGESVVDRFAAPLLFALLVVFHLWAVSVGWKSELLQGNEFRQSQTAVTTLFVQREHNFSLAYPTPVLGKPWSVPMEFPLYQWTVAVVSSTTGLPLIQAARAVSCVCFYLALPALWLLMVRLGLSRTQRWIALGVMLTCPLYVFYARAFLIETMALMFSLWFLQSFIAAVEQRSPFWVLLANIAGVGAGLVKVTTFMLYLAPAGIFACIWLFRTRHGSRINLHLARSTLGWIAACVVVPFLATLWWIKLADAIKALNPSGIQLLSSLMNSYHFGTWETRTSPDIWLSHWRTLTTNIVPVAGLVVFLGLAALTAPRWRKWVVALALLFIAAPATFPVLYAWHEYYFVANGVLLLTAMGIALASLQQARLPRVVIWTVIVAVHAIQVWGYLHYLYPEQRLVHRGGSGLTRLLRDVTDPDDVLIIAGNDWSSVIPFYSERRALMIRTRLERDTIYLERAFREIENESVPVLILVGSLRDDTPFLEHVIRRFDLHPEAFLIHKDQTVYVARAWREEYTKRLFNLTYNDVEFAIPSERQMSDQPQTTSHLERTRFLQMLSPTPERYQLPFGVSFGFERDGTMAFGAHAPSRLWFRWPAGARHISIEFLVSEGAYTREGDHSDGVEFVALQRQPDGTERVLFSRLLEPHGNPSDRGVQRAELTVDLPDSAEVIFETRPGPTGSNAFDWSFWKSIRLH